VTAMASPASLFPNLRSTAPPEADLPEPWRGRAPRPERLDESGRFLGMGRSLTFPFRQWRDVDQHRTVFFDEGRGDPIVFVHGLGGNATHFEPILPRLGERHRIIGLDLVGLGWTAKPDVPYRVEMLRDHLLDFLDRHHVERPTLVGHSLGGAVCLSAALARPHGFRSLALLCAAGVAPLPAWMRLAAPVFLRRWLLFPTLALGANVILDNVFVDHPRDNAQVRWFRESVTRDDPGYPNLYDFARVCESLCRDLTHHDFSAELASLELPVLAIWGDRDKLTCRGSVLAEVGRIPRIRTVMMRAGHMPMVERPDETLFHLERLLTDPP
jgi:pimeloyl-ACP methyl ester carboxylesterase